MEVTDTEIDASQKRATLLRIIQSPEFAGAERLKAFLTYIVEQEIAGKKDKIVGKTILADVYNNGARGAANSATVVRVDANRMRQRLELYYTRGGKLDPVRLSVDKGGYIPRFYNGVTRNKNGASNDPSAWLNLRTGVVAASFVTVALVSFAAATWLLPQEETDLNAYEVSPKARTALFENAPTKLLARNTAEEARQLLFPATQLPRVSAALSMFEAAMKLDPNYYGGFAGASEASSILAALSPDASHRKEHFENAVAFADKALTLDPTKAWCHSASAFTSLIARDFQAANRLSLKALALEPNNTHALEIDAIIAIFSGEFERAISSADPALHADRPGSGLPWRNALGNAYFHVGDYAKSIKHLTDAIKAGEPVSEINMSHLIAAHEASGNHAKAMELVRAFEASWPDSRLSKLLLKIFENPNDAERILIEMENAGWTDPLARISDR